MRPLVGEEIGAAMETPREALEELLLTLFNADELRIFVRRLEGGTRLEAALPGGDVPLNHLISEAVGAFERQGLINVDLVRQLESICREDPIPDAQDAAWHALLHQSQAEADRAARLGRRLLQ